MGAGIKSPCKICSIRSPGCHGSCPEYQKFKRDLNELKHLIPADADIRAYHKARHYDLLKHASPSQRKWLK